MNRNAVIAALEDINRLNNLIPRQVREAQEMMRRLQYDRQLLEAARGPLAHRAVLDAQLRWQQMVELDSAQLRAMRDIMASLHQLPDHVSAVQGFLETLQTAQSYLDQGSAGFLRYARESLDAFFESLYASPADFIMLDPARWLDEGIEELLADDPKYRKSKLAWILAIFVPRFRLALHEQDQDGDFDGVMQVLWEDLLNDPEVRTRLRERLEKTGVRAELRKSLSSHLDKIEAGELMYAILGLYAHIEGFLAEIAVERNLIPDKESIVNPKGETVPRRGVHELIRALHGKGQIDESQEKFLTFVLSNNYMAHRIRHGNSDEFTQERATALVLVLILVLCLSFSMSPSELLDEDKDEDTEGWMDDLLAEESEGSDSV